MPRIGVFRQGSHATFSGRADFHRMLVIVDGLG